MAYEFELEDVRLAGEAAIAAKPEGYVYTNQEGVIAGTDPNGDTISCRYIHRVKEDGGDKLVSGCYAGDVLVRLGFQMLDLDMMSGYIEDYETFLDGKLSPDAIQFLSEVQHAQDNGMPWRQAHDEALEMING